MDRTGKDSREGSIENAILIAGPTASGKSRLALRLAAETGGVIVNADSMQVYDILSVLTARPSAEDLAAAPHHLYGHIHPSVAYSTGQYLRDVGNLAEAGVFSRRPIFVGGTGLYFKALLNGLSKMPDIPAAIRTHWRARLEAEDSAALHAVLAARDPQAAARLAASDGQRTVRALEVLEASGRSIVNWQAARGAPLIHEPSAIRYLVEVDRSDLSGRIASRLQAMVAAGVLDEVRALLALDLDPALPAMRAIGVPEFASALRGQASVEEAIAQAATATRQYAKRQMTWFRHQLGPGWMQPPLAVPDAFRE